jgi:amidase
MNEESIPLSRRSALRAVALSAAAQQMSGKTESLCFLSATELARRLRRKDVSAREVLEAHLRQIESLNPKVNAIVTLVQDRAMEQAARADEAAARGRFLGPLHGLPIAHKDLEETKGIRTTYGSPIFRDHVPDFDTLLVERIKRAGAINIGKTNTPEFGAGSQTFNPVFGATRNPYDLSKTCGGSSGGAAVALACRMLPIADGSDMGGSLRNPASFCSIVGFRTSPGRVPKVPSTSAWNTLSVLGPMARSVEDTALFLSAIAGPDPRAPLSIHEPGSRFAQPLGRNTKGIRIAWCANVLGLPFSRSVKDVFSAQQKVFNTLECAVSDAEPDLTDADEIFKVYRALSFYQAHLEKVQRHRDLVKATVIQEVERGERLTLAEIAQADTKRSRLFARLGQFMERFDFFVLPTVQVPPFDVDQQYVTEIEGSKMGNYIDWMRSCYYITVTALPAISVPAGFTADGLPVGLQIVGRHQDDWGVLQIAHAYEQARGQLRTPAIAEA